MDERKHIEDADIVVDISGGKLAAQTYRKRIAELKDQLATANEEIAFWMGEGDGTEWPPENIEWRKLFDCKKRPRPPKQLKRMQQLATLIKWKCDEKIQYERAELAESKLVEGMEDEIPDLYKKVGKKLRLELDNAGQRELRLLKVLRALYDEQNGPPLIRDEKQWQEAYDNAGDILEELGGLKNE